MAVERDFELLDDYLSNRLNAEDKAAFEKQVQADPQLKQELEIQKDLVEGLKQARAIELKSMLNNIPISPVSGGNSILTKVGTWAVIAGLVVTGIYFYSAEDEENGTAKPTVAEQQPAITPELSEASETTESTNTEANKKEQPAKPIQKVGKKKADTKPEVSAPAPGKPSAYDPSQDEADAATKKYEREQLEVISKAFVTSSIEVETDTMNRKYSFHYVFKEDKLILYGAFEKHLYEILEFIGDDKRTVVLFYKSNYYLLNIEKTTPTKLSPIHDRKLLKKLKDYRSK